MAAHHQHALVVGGTGMLRGVVLWLADRGHTVTVVARDQARLDAVARSRGDARIVGLPIDYSDDERLRQALSDAVRRRGPLATAVLWIRPGAPKALDTIASIADAGGGEAADHRCRFFRILGSAAADPETVRTGNAARFKAMEGLDYREVILGFRVGEHGARWNTNEEIAAGVIEALERDLPAHVVGVVRPWALRPSRR